MKKVNLEGNVITLQQEINQDYYRSGFWKFQITFPLQVAS